MVTLAAPANRLAISPHVGETQMAFAQRADRELRQQFPDAQARSVAAIAAWQNSAAGQQLEDIAVAKFPREQFERIAPRPVFAEHSTTNNDGRQVTYGPRELELICRNCNRRILDTGDFSPLTAGHTPEEEDIHRPQPPVLGYCGPFYMGLIGNQRPRWAIFCDEWHHREDAAQLRKLQRRSPEVWTGGPMEERYFDPVAALGAAAPRLDMGLTRFHRSPTGQLVQKYSMTYPSGSSTFVPGSAGKSSQQPTRHQAGDTAMAMSPEDIRQIVDAVMETAPMKWAASQMNSGGQSPDDAGQGAATATPTAPAPEDDMDDDERQKYAAMSPDMQQSYMAGRMAAKKKYAGDQSMQVPTPAAPANPSPDPVQNERYSRLSRENADLKNRLDAVETKHRHTERYHKLSELNREYDFPLEEEFGDVKDVPADQFNRHCARIVARYSRRPVNEMPDLFAPDLPTGEKRETPADRERYHKAALGHVSRMRREGKEVTYDDALAHVKSQQTV